MKKLILGSQSPRRGEILGHYTIPFEQASSDFDEETIPFSGDPKQYVLELSQGKSEVLVKSFPDTSILTADTVVFQDGKIYNKPVNREDAVRMLSELAGKWHSVFTGITLRHEGNTFQRAEETKVEFNPLSPSELQAYVATNRWKDKAAGYGIQTSGGIIVKQIAGCYYNVMGLPINALRELLIEMDVNLFDYLK